MSASKSSGSWLVSFGVCVCMCILSSTFHLWAPDYAGPNAKQPPVWLPLSCQNPASTLMTLKPKVPPRRRLDKKPKRRETELYRSPIKTLMRIALGKMLLTVSVQYLAAKRENLWLAFHLDLRTSISVLGLWWKWLQDFQVLRSVSALREEVSFGSQTRGLPCSSTPLTQLYVDSSPPPYSPAHTHACTRARARARTHALTVVLTLWLADYTGWRTHVQDISAQACTHWHDTT